MPRSKIGANVSLVWHCLRKVDRSWIEKIRSQKMLRRALFLRTFCEQKSPSSLLLLGSSRRGGMIHEEGAVWAQSQDSWPAGAPPPPGSLSQGFVRRGCLQGPGLPGPARRVHTYQAIKWRPPPRRGLPGPGSERSSQRGFPRDVEFGYLRQLNSPRHAGAVKFTG